MSDPLRELIKHSVLELLEARQYDQAKWKYEELTKEITLASERRDWDDWFDNEVRRYIVPYLITQKQHDKVMEIYKEQKGRNDLHPHSCFESVWQNLLEAPERERQKQLRQQQAEERGQQALERFQAFNRTGAWFTAVVAFLLGLIFQHPLLMVVGTALLVLCCFLERNRRIQLRKLRERDPLGILEKE